MILGQFLIRQLLVQNDPRSCHKIGGAGGAGQGNGLNSIHSNRKTLNPNPTAQWSIQSTVVDQNIGPQLAMMEMVFRTFSIIDLQDL